MNRQRITRKPQISLGIFFFVIPALGNKEQTTYIVHYVPRYIVEVLEVAVPHFSYSTLAAPLLPGTPTQQYPKKFTFVQRASMFPSFPTHPPRTSPQISQTSQTSRTSPTSNDTYLRSPFSIIYHHLTFTHIIMHAPMSSSITLYNPHTTYIILYHPISPYITHTSSPI